MTDEDEAAKTTRWEQAWPNRWVLSGTRTYSSDPHAKSGTSDETSDNDDAEPVMKEEEEVDALEKLKKDKEQLTKTIQYGQDIIRAINLSPDHVIISSESPLPRIELEMTLCMWRNHFTCDIIGSEGSAHIESLCKWGPSKFTHRRRVFPAGKPLETEIVQSMDDPTWKLEYENFRTSIEVGKKDTLDKDIWLYDTLKELEKFIVV